MPNNHDVVTSLFGRSSIRGTLAAVIVVGCFVFLFLLMYKRIPQGNEAALNVAMGFVLGILATVCGFYFGSSKQQADVEKATSAVAILKATPAPETEEIKTEQ